MSKIFVIMFKMAFNTLKQTPNLHIYQYTYLYLVRSSLTLSCKPRKIIIITKLICYYVMCTYYYSTIVVNINNQNLGYP